MNTNAPKCDTCGRFYSWREPGSSWVFVPDSAVTREELVNACARCTAEHGPPIPWQRVDVSKCSGVVESTPEDT